MIQLLFLFLLLVPLLVIIPLAWYLLLSLRISTSLQNRLNDPTHNDIERSSSTIAPEFDPEKTLPPTPSDTKNNSTRTNSSVSIWVDGVKTSRLEPKSQSLFKKYGYLGTHNTGRIKSDPSVSPIAISHANMMARLPPDRFVALILDGDMNTIHHSKTLRPNLSHSRTQSLTQYRYHTRSPPLVHIHSSTHIKCLGHDITLQNPNNFRYSAITTSSNGFETKALVSEFPSPPLRDTSNDDEQNSISQDTEKTLEDIPPVYIPPPPALSPPFPNPLHPPPFHVDEKYRTKDSLGGSFAPPPRPAATFNSPLLHGRSSNFLGKHVSTTSGKSSSPERKSKSLKKRPPPLSAVFSSEDIPRVSSSRRTRSQGSSPTIAYSIISPLPENTTSRYSDFRRKSTRMSLDTFGKPGTGTTSARSSRSSLYTLSRTSSMRSTKSRLHNRTYRPGKIVPPLPSAPYYIPPLHFEPFRFQFDAQNFYHKTSFDVFCERNSLLLVDKTKSREFK